MAGPLAYVYGRANALRRQLGDLVSDPVGSVQQTLGGLQDAHRENQMLQAQAFANPREPFAVTDQNALSQLANKMLTGPLGMAPGGMTAWHGSPHTFDQFDSSKIGTGEGAQVYGHGLYLAQNPKVASGYRDALAGWTIRGTPIRQLDRYHDEIRMNVEAGNPFDVAKQSAVNSIRGDIKAERGALELNRPWANQEKIADLERRALELESLQPTDMQRVKGALYKVDLPDEKVGQMIDWDKPLHRQAPHIRKHLQSEVSNWMDRETYAQWIRNRPDWRDFQDNMMAHLPNEEVTARARAAGIPGVKYLDAGSRPKNIGNSELFRLTEQHGPEKAAQMMAKGVYGQKERAAAYQAFLDEAQGYTRNYVVFPGEENALKILERNGQALGPP